MRTLGGSVRSARRAIVALALVQFALLPSAAGALEIRPLTLPQLNLLRRNQRTHIAKFDWYTSYNSAVRDAKRERRMLVINFVPSGDDEAQHDFEKYVSENKALRKQLQFVTLARIPVDARVDNGNASHRLIDEPAFKHLGGKPGIAILDFQHKGHSFYGKVVNVLPFTPGKYYRWESSHLAVALDLPAGTITQRSMVWAVRTHPDNPQSTTGEQSPALASAAAKQSAYQASIGLQGHHHWEKRFHQVRAVTHSASASEVVAESWPGQDLIDSCVDCVKCWRYSSGHWSAVRKHHRLYGYDIRLGSNGIWYGTGIFAN